MALDKLVDSAQLDADLASVASAIRAKGGTSGQLQFPGGFVDAIQAISGGGGDAQFASGTITVVSTVNVPNSGMLFPGLQLSFVPDYLEIWMDRASFEAIETPENNHYYRIVAVPTQDTYPQYRSSASVSGDATYFSKNWWFAYASNALAFSDPLTGYGLANWGAMVDVHARPAWSVNDDGTLTIARFSSATPSLYAGTYHYIAYKGGTA